MKKKRWILLTIMAILGLVVAAYGLTPTPMPPTGTPAVTPTPIPPMVAPNITPAAPPATASAGDTWTRPADGMVMVYVPAGEFLMGGTDGDDQADGDEKPQHSVYLDAF